MAQPKPRATQADIARALRAAEKTGLNVAVDILPDGTIRLIPMNGRLTPQGSDRAVVERPRPRL